MNVGSMNEQQSANQLQDQINRFNFAQQEPLNRLGTYNALIQGNYGGQTTQTSPLYVNQGANALGGGLGGALAGAKLGSMFPGIGTGLGALGGGLLGGIFS
jgi:hypothetical protein